MAIAAIGIVIAAGIAGVRKQAVSLPLRIAALAVLPLENLSHDPEQRYFADGLTDALITDLAKMGSTRITSRTSVIQYLGTKKSVKDIGRELNVDAVVEGTVTYGGDRVRVTAQLIQVSTDMHLWADAYEREVSSILDLQRSLATDIARRIDDFVKPLDRARVVKPEAYGLTSRGGTPSTNIRARDGRRPSSTSIEQLRAIRNSRPRIRVFRRRIWSRARTARSRRRRR